MPRSVGFLCCVQNGRFPGCEGSSHPEIKDEDELQRDLANVTEPKCRPPFQGDRLNPEKHGPKTTNGTAIYADQLTPSQPPQFSECRHAYMAVPWSVWVGVGCPEQRATNENLTGEFWRKIGLVATQKFRAAVQRRGSP